MLPFCQVCQVNCHQNQPRDGKTKKNRNKSTFFFPGTPERFLCLPWLAPVNRFPGNRVVCLLLNLQHSTAKGCDKPWSDRGFHWKKFFEMIRWGFAKPIQQSVHPNLSASKLHADPEVVFKERSWGVAAILTLTNQLLEVLCITSDVCTWKPQNQRTHWAEKDL